MSLLFIDSFCVLLGLEQSVVPWKKDEDEKRCVQCGRGFGVRRRRHHCRLCGGIICKQCSHFMTLGETCECDRGHWRNILCDVIWLCL